MPSVWSRSTLRHLVLLHALALASLCSDAWGAEPLDPNRVYSGGTAIRVPEIGVTLSVPLGWQAGSDEQSFVMINENRTMAIIVRDHMGEIETLARELTAAPVELDPETVLDPATDVWRAPGRLTAFYTVRNGWPKRVARVDVLGGPSGYNVILVGIAEEGTAADLDRVVEDLVAGVIFESPQLPEVVRNAGGWSDYLSDLRLYRSYSGSGGYYEEEEIQLCPDGQFVRRWQAAPGMSGGSQGTWFAEGEGALARLLLQDHVGALTTRQVTVGDGEIFLDAQRFATGRAGCG